MPSSSILRIDADQFMRGAMESLKRGATVNDLFSRQIEDLRLWDDTRTFRGGNVHNMGRPCGIVNFGKRYQFRADCDECLADAWDRMTFGGFKVPEYL